MNSFEKLFIVGKKLENYCRTIKNFHFVRLEPCDELLGLVEVIPTEKPNTTMPLKVPKRENFSLAFFAQSEPTWVCDLGSGEKNRIFYQMTPVYYGFWFFAAY